MATHTASQKDLILSWIKEHLCTLGELWAEARAGSQRFPGIIWPGSSAGYSWPFLPFQEAVVSRKHAGDSSCLRPEISVG